MTVPLEFLTVSPHRDRHNRTILLLHSDTLPYTTTSPTSVQTALQVVPPNEPLTLVYLHAGLAATTNTTLTGVRTFRALYEAHVPHEVRARIQQIAALHVSFVTRAHIYTASFRLQCADYSKLVYCDLLADLENLLGVDSTLLGLRNIDFDYDEEMRCWVGRQHEGQPRAALPKAPNPRKPLINTQDVSVSLSEQDMPETSQPSLAEP